MPEWIQAHQCSPVGMAISSRKCSGARLGAHESMRQTVTVGHPCRPTAQQPARAFCDRSAQPNPCPWDKQLRLQRPRASRWPERALRACTARSGRPVRRPCGVLLHSQGGRAATVFRAGREGSREAHHPRCSVDSVCWPSRWAGGRDGSRGSSGGAVYAERGWWGMSYPCISSMAIAARMCACMHHIHCLPT